MRKRSESQATWALITEGVASARVEAHLLRQAYNRVLRLLDELEVTEEANRYAGDLIQEAPKRLTSLESVLDKTQYALTKVGVKDLITRVLPADRDEVDAALDYTSKPLAKKSDLTPPLGYPGGSCHVVNRILNKVRDPRDRTRLVEDVQEGDDLSNADAAKIYPLDTEKGAGLFRSLEISGHAAYRMDLRGVTVPEVRVALVSLSKQLSDWKSQKSPLWDWATKQMTMGTYEWYDAKMNLVVVVRSSGAQTLKLVTTYRKGEPDPRPTSCRI